MTILFGSAPAA